MVIMGFICFPVFFLVIYGVDLFFCSCGVYAAQGQGDPSQILKV